MGTTQKPPHSVLHVCLRVYVLVFEMKTKDYFKEMSLYDIYLKFTESGWACADGQLVPKTR
jgi:hypothetical protein